MVEFVIRKPAVRGEQAYPGLLHAGVLKTENENSLDFAVRAIPVLVCLPLHMFARLALRDLTNQNRERTDWTKRDIGLLEESAIGLNVGCASLHDR